MAERVTYQGTPTLAQVMRRPRWILALLLALGVAAGFASLAQWQMGTAVKLQETELDSETVHPLQEITEPGTPVNDQAGGRMVSFSASLVPGDAVVVGQRVNGGTVGYWVVGHALLSDGNSHLTIALGWAEQRETAQAVADRLNEAASTTPALMSGRYMPSEGVAMPDPGDPLDELTTLAVGQQVNLWQSMQGVAYSGYLVSADAPEGLEVIDSFAPLPQEKINWLNLFYAVEWVVFAGFALFFWYRLARDAWEKEHELNALRAESSGAASVE